MFLIRDTSVVRVALSNVWLRQACTNVLDDPLGVDSKECYLVVQMECVRACVRVCVCV